MKKRLIFLSVIMCSVCLASGDQAKIDALVNKLGAGTFKERKEADVQLRELDKTIIEFLDKYKESDDPEIRMRIGEIIKYLETKPLMIKFEDDQLFRVMRKAAGTALICDSNVATINRINAEIAGIRSIKGMRYLPNVISLYLRRNEISDISELKHMTSLRYVDLTSNNITDITPLIENYKSRQHKQSLKVYLSGNPLKEELLKQMEDLRSLGAEVYYVTETNLPKNVKPSCPEESLVPYAGLDLSLQFDDQQQADLFFNEHRMLRIELGTKLNGKVIPNDILKHIWLSKTKNHNWRIYSSPGATSDATRPMKPGKYVYEFVVSTQEARFKCPPLTVTVAVPDDKKEIIEAFEKSGASGFMTNEQGFRRADKPKDPKVDYKAVCDFLDKHPESFLTQVIADKITKIGKDDLYERVKINPEDRKGLAAIAVRVVDDYVYHTGKALRGMEISFEKYDRNDPFAKGPTLETRKRRIDITREWLKHAQSAESTTPSLHDGQANEED